MPATAVAPRGGARAEGRLPEPASGHGVGRVFRWYDVTTQLPPAPETMQAGPPPQGGTIITAVDDASLLTGMTATAVSAVSLEPLLLLACLNRSSRTSALIRRRARFRVSVLRDGQ
jgi:hypothetical protein